MTALALTRIETPIGAMLLLAAEPGGAVAVLEFEDQPERLHRALARHPGATLHPADGRHTAALAAYFAGDLAATGAIPLHPCGTPFQRRAWSALRAIAPGSTCSYTALAARIGHPKAVRAVGAANGANPVSIIVPCHGLVGGTGALMGYGGGVDRKRWLLEHEARGRLTP